MAQDFHAAFQVGPDDTHIAVVDESGVALAAIQGLNEMIDEKEAVIRAQDARIQAQAGEIAQMKERLEKLEQLMAAKQGAAK
jgi:hypothetical protein